MTLVNMYLEISQDQDKSLVSAHRTAGLTLFADYGDTPNRGMHALGDYNYVVHLGTFYQINNSGVRVSKGTLATTSGRVSMADNGLQIIIVDGTTAGYIYTIASDTFATIADADFPGGETVAFNDGYFIVNKPASGRFYISDSYNGLSWDALKFSTAESSPDNLIAIWADHGELILFGEVTTEFWVNSGALDFAYSRIGASAEWGLAARWSVTKFDNSLMWLAKNRMGEVQVVRLNGYQPTRVSTHDIERIFNGYTSISAATALSYMKDGHPFYQINFTEASWLYDGATQKWSQLKSATGRHRGEIAVTYLNKTIMSDFSGGKLYRLDSAAYTDNGEMIVAEITGKHVFNAAEPFSISELHLDMETGVGLATGQGSTPRVMLQISKDSGHTWGVERFGNIGAAGEYKTRARWTRLGQAREFTFRFRVSDPVKVSVNGAWIS